MVMIRTNDEIEQGERAVINADLEAEKAASPDTGAMTGLIANLRRRWETAVLAKRNSGVEDQFFKNLDMINKVYDNARRAAIKEMNGSDTYLGVVETKVRHGKAWVRDALFPPGKKPYGVKPTPSPDLPQDIIQQETQRFVSETLQAIQQQSAAAGVQVDMGMAVQEIQNSFPELQRRVKNELRKISWEKCQEMEKEIDDQLLEGEWYDALDRCVPDIIALGTGIMLGPFKRKRKLLVASQSGAEVQNKMVKGFERASPFNVYPQADSSGPDDGYVFVKLPYRKLDLQDLIGAPGFDNIEAVLAEAGSGKLREWTLTETERAMREKKSTESVYDTDIIDCLLYMGSLSGGELREAGIEIPENKKYFDFLCNVWFVGNHVIRAMINEDPFGKQPISIAHFDENNDGWWGKGLPETIEPDSHVINACARATVNNVAMGSGPQCEINTDRLKGGDKGDTRLMPWKRWLTNSKGMQTGPAITFWQPAMHAQEILYVLNDFKKGADERCGIPGYSHGDSQVGGAGNTASGLSMLITQAARGIRGIIKNVDKNMISRSVGFVYNELALDPKYQEFIGDVQLIAMGSQILVEKEQRAVRMLELLNATNNPNDLALMGAEGRGYLLGEVARTYEIDPERALPMLELFKGKPLGQVPPEGAPAPGPGAGSRGTPPVAGRTLDAAGNEPQGGASQLMAGRGGPAASPE